MCLKRLWAYLLDILRPFLAFLFVFFVLVQPLFAQEPRCTEFFTARRDFTVSRTLQEEAFFSLRTGDDARYIQLVNQLTGLLHSGRFVQKEVVPEAVGHNSTEVYFVTLDNGLKAVWKPDPSGWVSMSKEWQNSHPTYEVFASRIDSILHLGLIPVTILREHQGTWGSLQAFVNLQTSLQPITPLSDLQRQAVWSKAKLFDYIFGVADRRIDIVFRNEGHNYFVLQDQPVLFDNGMILVPDLMRRMQPDEYIKMGIDFQNPHLQSFFHRLRDDLTIDKLYKLLQPLGVENEVIYHVFNRRNQILSFFLLHK